MKYLCVLICLSTPLAAQEVQEVQEFDTSVFDGLSLDMFNPSFEDFGDVETKGPKPQAYGDCLVAEDGLTPVICAGSDSLRPMPEGFIWRDDPELTGVEARHCLFWVEGGEFVGHPLKSVCRDGAFVKEEKGEGVLMKF